MVPVGKDVGDGFEFVLGALPQHEPAAHAADGDREERCRSINEEGSFGGGFGTGEPTDDGLAMSGQTGGWSELGAHQVGHVQSLLATCVLHGVDPYTYLVDVRTEAEYRAGAIPSALNIPFDVIADNLPTEDRSDRIIVYCRSGNRSGVAADTLEGLGFTNVLDFGAVGNWRGELEVRQ